MSARARIAKSVCGASVALALLCHEAAAEFRWPESYNAFGVFGLVEMPTAAMPEDAEAAITVMRGMGQSRTSLTFQILPRISGTFRYSVIEDFFGADNGLYDRSFDLRFGLTEERGGWPAISVGLQDFLGTGVFSGEYLVATKHVTPRLAVTGGLGWGRYAGRDGFDNPLGLLGDRFETRPAPEPGGGRFNADTWFRGDAAIFGGLEWQATDRLSLKLEYSTDSYDEETSRGLVDQDLPVNLGATYRIRPGLDISAYALYGSEVGFQLTTSFNPKRPPNGATPEAAPPPVAPRGSAEALGWRLGDDLSGLRARLAPALLAEGIALDAVRIDGDRADVRVRNLRYRATAQAIGRTARVLTRTIPAYVERFAITVAEAGIPVSTVTLRRTDLETLEHAPDGAWQAYVRADVADAAGSTLAAAEALPRFEWRLGPYLDTELFDPDDPLRADVGLRAEGRLAIAEGLFISGSLRKKAFGTLDQSTRPSDSVLPRVRSENAIYNREGDPALEYLVVEQFYRPGENLFGRVSAGYLEKMYGGVSAELLWKPGPSRFGLGAEINYARQRDFDQRFGFRDYDVVTGHLSGYFDLGGGFHAQLDAGRYLAGDWGTTLSLDREFANGIRVGAFATFTDVSFADFGEGSFDKGIRVTMPLAWLTGRESRDRFDTTIRPVLRDGGARLDVPNRLYETVRSAQPDAIGRDWARFWR